MLLTYLPASAADAVGLDPVVWGPGIVLIGLFMAGQIVPGYLWRQERDERKRLQGIVEQLLPTLEKSADINEKAVDVIRDAADVIRASRASGDREQR